MNIIKIDKYKCERCEHAWIPRKPVRPRICPICKSPYWDVKKIKGGIVKK